MEGEVMERTTLATIEEIRLSPAYGRPAKTIFFGGGTPTFLQENQLVRILEAVLEAHPPIPGCEITSEANPGTVDVPKFRAMREAGFNRISLGAQSFLDSDLVRLGRVHRSGEIETAVEKARQAGFENLNLDLMFALPGQSTVAWRRNLDRAITMAPEHLSLYCLTIEPNTAFYKQHLRGQLVVPDEESQLEMYDECVLRMAEAGYRQYEISNFAKPGRECAHNLGYWRAEEYAGYGPGAVGRIGSRRHTNLKHPDLYCEAVEQGREIFFESETVDEKTLQIERIMLGLRLNDGIDRSLADPAGLRKAERMGWLESTDGRVRLTLEGRHLHNEVAVELMPA
jgi:oxygen-independent coproporphyrinogen-3 oxidase